MPLPSPWTELSALGADPALVAAAEEAATSCGLPPPGGPGGPLPARVARRERDAAVVVTPAPLTVGLGRCPAAADLTAGDWVLVDGGAVVAVLPRRTSLVRGAGRRDARAQTVAANVDVVLVVHALTEAPNAARLERLLALVWAGGARPVVVLTKADLVTGPAGPTGEVAEVRALAPGTPVLAVSVVDGTGLSGPDGLAELLPEGGTVAVVGRSGAGKSSLLNALAGGEVFGTAAVREDGKGRHTTTVRELVALPGGRVLLDTPGLRGVQVWDVEEGLDHVFTDVAALAASCRFSDCGHGSEPGCAVLAATEDGSLPLRRLESWRHLQRESAALARRHDARLASEARKVWARRGRDARARARVREDPRRARG